MRLMVMYVGGTQNIGASTDPGDQNPVPANWAVSDATKVSLSTAGPSPTVTLTALAATTTGSIPSYPDDYGVTVTATAGGLTQTMLIAFLAAAYNPNPGTPELWLNILK